MIIETNRIDLCFNVKTFLNDLNENEIDSNQKVYAHSIRAYFNLKTDYNEHIKVFNTNIDIGHTEEKINELDLFSYYDNNKELIQKELEAEKEKILNRFK